MVLADERHVPFGLRPMEATDRSRRSNKTLCYVLMYQRQRTQEPSTSMSFAGRTYGWYCPDGDALSLGLDLSDAVLTRGVSSSWEDDARPFWA